MRFFLRLITPLFCVLFASLSFAQSNILFDQKGVSGGYSIRALESFNCVDEYGDNLYDARFTWYEISFWVSNRTDKRVKFSSIYFSIDYQDTRAITCNENPKYNYPNSASGDLFGLGFNGPQFPNRYLQPNSSFQGKVWGHSTHYPAVSVGINGIRWVFLDSGSTDTTGNYSNDV